MNEVKPIWEPSAQLRQQSYMYAFLRRVNQHNHLNIYSYDDLKEWGIDNLEALTDDLKLKIKNALRLNYSQRHMPDEIYSIEEIPYTSNGKKKEIEFAHKLKKELL